MTLCLNPACSTRNAPDTQFCIKCGTKLIPLVCLNKSCASVHHAPDAQFCMRCGVKLTPIQFQPARYRQLEVLLAAENWLEADHETARVMKEVANRTEQGNLQLEDIDNFPCEDLQAIDGLWVKYSNGRFGFSVQKRIYQSLGGTREYEQSVLKKLGYRVGWLKETSKSWSYNHYITFSNKAPEGYFPIKWVEIRPRWDEGEGNEWEKRHISSLLSHQDL